MNIYAIIILLALVLNLVLDTVADLLNLKRLKLSLPSQLEGVYKAEEYQKSQKYTREVTRFGMIHSIFTLLAILAFWFSGGFNSFDQVVRPWGLHAVLSGLIYIGVLLLSYSLITLPFSLYGTFVIEQRYGFNKTTARTFFLDLVKEFCLALALGGLLLGGALALFEYGGPLAWLYCWIGVVLFSLILQYVAPNWIMPLFNKFKPLDAGELRDAILKYTASVRFPISNIMVMDGSRRSSRSNAFFSGFGKHKRIALFDTLIEKHTVAELVAVLAHEVGHNKKQHIFKGMIISFLRAGLLFYFLSLFITSSGLSQAFYMEQSSIYSGLLFFGLLYTPLEMAISIIMQIVSRKDEYEADRFAASSIPDPQSMIEALKKLSATNLSNLTPHPFYVFLNYSHPPLLERVQAIEKLKSQVKKSPQA
jgi:STE24 endopeptidase